MTSHLEHLILIGRPASGKSELIDFLKKLPLGQRIEKYRIANIVEIDDFPWIWEKFMEDNMWEELGRKRFFSKRYEDGNCGVDPKDLAIMDLMMKKFNYEIAKKYLPDQNFYKDNTLFIEFSRGGSDAYKKSLNMLSPEIFKKVAILYNKVSYEESRRKNDKRYEEKKKHSILAHKTADEIFEQYYNIDDWDSVSGGSSCGALDIHGQKVPFVTVNNEPETTDAAELEKRYGPPLNQLFSAKYRA